MRLKRILSVAALAAATILGTALAVPSTMVHAATISDPLTRGSTVATRQSGGQFTGEGWKVTDNARGNKIGQYLMYALPGGTTAGVLEFEAKGIRFNKAPDGSREDPREHMFGVFDMDKPHDMPASGSSGYQLRFYDHQTPTGTFKGGSHRFRFMSPATSDIDSDRKNAVAWDPNRWYRFKFEWSQTGATWWKDGVLQNTLTIRSQNKCYCFLYVGSDYRAVGRVPVNVIYRNVKITTR